MKSPRADVFASPAGTAANHHYRLPPMVPQKIASYCHVKHSRKEMPDLPKETVRSLVQVHLLKAMWLTSAVNFPVKVIHCRT